MFLAVQIELTGHVSNSHVAKSRGRGMWCLVVLERSGFPSHDGTQLPPVVRKHLAYLGSPCRLPERADHSFFLFVFFSFSIGRFALRMCRRFHSCIRARREPLGNPEIYATTEGWRRWGWQTSDSWACSPCLWSLAYQSRCWCSLWTCGRVLCSQGAGMAGVFLWMAATFVCVGSSMLYYIAKSAAVNLDHISHC